MTLHLSSHLQVLHHLLLGGAGQSATLALGLGHQTLDHAPAALLPALARTLALALEAHSGRRR